MSNSKLSLFGRYNYSPSNFFERGFLPSPYTVLSTTEALSSSVHTFTLGLTQLVKSGMSNEIRANYSNQRVGEKLIADNFGGAKPIPDSLLFPPGYSSANGGFLLFIVGAGEYGQGQVATDEQRQINLVDNLTLSAGSHQLKFGADYRWLSPFSNPFSYRQFAEFLGVQCPPAPTACTGYTPSATAAFADVEAFQAVAVLTQDFSFYGQDTWKISARLTVTYGLRWDINTPLKGKNLANQPFTVMGLNNPATMTLAPRGTPLYQTTYGNVAPRVGLAYQLRNEPGRETVLRGGFGIFYDLGYGSLGGASSYFPFDTVNVIAPSSTPCPSSPSVSTGVCFPLSAEDDASPVPSTSPPVSTLIVAHPNLRLPRTYEWNVALEQSLGISQSVSFTHIGAIGRDLLRVTNLNNPNPDFQFVSVTDNSATSDYHALQVKLQRRLSQGLQALASYTFSHSIDIASTDAFANYLNTPSFIANPNIDLDIRHTFTAGVTYGLPTPQWNKFARATWGVVGGRFCLGAIGSAC